MYSGQQTTETKFLCRATSRQRLTAIIVFLVVLALFALAWLAAHSRTDLTFLLGRCGFKQRYGLPCPSCGMTTAVLAFAGGRLPEAFYIQPAAALFCCIAAMVGFLAFLTAVFGVYCARLNRALRQLRPAYIILAAVFVILCGWLVTLTRALAERAA